METGIQWTATDNAWYHGNMVIDELKKKIVPLLKQNRVTRAGLFGSAARGEMRKDSDIDVLVDLHEDASLLDLVGLKQQLEEALGRKIDLVEYQTIKPTLRDSILKQELRLV
ncbi:MAG: nucleotidyltransferase family protein [Patescibacteria group bacterium]